MPEIEGNMDALDALPDRVHSEISVILTSKLDQIGASDVSASMAGSTFLIDAG